MEQETISHSTMDLTSSGSSFSTFAIRAPLTLDSDSEYSNSSQCQNDENGTYNNSTSSSNGSDVSEFETNGLSGEDELKRPFVADPNDDSQEKCGFVTNHDGFRPFVNYPLGKNNNGDKFGDFGVDPDEGLIENNGFVEDTVDTDGDIDENGVCRAYVFGTNGERASVKSVEGERYGNFGAGSDGEFLRNHVGKSDEFGVSRAYVFGTNGERESVKSVEGDRYGDSGAGQDGDFVGNGDFVHNHVGRSNEFGVSGAHVSGTSEEGTRVNSILEGKFGFKPNDDLNEYGESVEDNIIIRSFLSDLCGQNNEMGVSLAYVADTDGQETSVEPIREGKDGDVGELSFVDIGISEIKNLIIPIANLSRDSDEESLLFEDVEDNEFSGSVRVSDTNILEMISDKVSADEELEEDGSAELDDQLIEEPEMRKNVVETTELRSEVVADDHGYTSSFVDETKGTISTKLNEESGNIVIGWGDIIDSMDEIKDLKLVVIGSADMVKRDDLGEETGDGPQRSYDIFGPLLMSTSKMDSASLLLPSLDFEFSGELEDKEGYDKGNSEGSNSIDDCCNDSLLADIEKTFSLNVLEESKDFWPKTESILTGDFNEKDDTHEESEEKEVFDRNISANSPRQNVSEEQNKNIDMIKLLRGNFSKLVQRLGLSLEDPIASHVLYRLILIEKELSNSPYTFGSALNTVMGLKWGSGKVDLDFSLNILVIGKTGVGKSATINSIFGEEKAYVSAFEPATTNVKEIIGTIDGIKLRIFDTPGLRPSAKQQSFNMKVLTSAKRLIRKHPLDIVLYVDRLDMGTRDLTDLPLLMSISKCLGCSIWQKAIITLTHGGSVQPDGPNSSPLTYDLHVAQRLRNIQLMISQSLGCSELNLNAVSSVSLVENHSTSSTGVVNGENLLLHREKWRPKLLLLCLSIKILYEANLVVRNQDLFYDLKFSGAKAGFLPLPHMLSRLLRSNSHSKTPEPGGAFSAFDEEYADEYDQLLPFKPSTKTFVKNRCLSNGLNRSLVNLPVIRWRDGIEWGGNLQSQFSLGRGSKLVLRAGLNDKLNGQVLVKISGSEQLQILLLSCFLMVDAIGRNYF